MFTNNKQQYWYAAALCLVGLLVSLTVLAVLPAQAQETTFVLKRIRAKKQSVEVLDAEGNSLGHGEFRAQISNNRGGRISGKAELRMPAVTFQFNPTDITINKQVPLEVVLNGRFVVTAGGQTQTSAGTITLKEGITSDLIIWDWPDDLPPTIDAASLAAVTELRFREE